MREKNEWSLIYLFGRNGSNLLLRNIAECSGLALPSSTTRACYFICRISADQGENPPRSKLEPKTHPNVSPDPWGSAHEWNGAFSDADTQNWNRVSDASMQANDIDVAGVLVEHQGTFVIEFVREIGPPFWGDFASFQGSFSHQP